MTKIVVADLHSKLTEAGIPIDGVALLKNGSVRIDFQGSPDTATVGRAQTIVKTYEQDAVDAEKTSAITSHDIQNAKSIDELKALLAKMLNDRA